MKTILRLALCIAALIAASSCASLSERGLRPAVVDWSGARNGYDVWTFHDALQPYGQWIEYPGYGWAWTPYRTSADWRPYTTGYWVDSDYGWLWVADEPWGWAPYHYGRWLEDPAYGWVWVPGSEWAPAWVAWRYDEDWVGWAPLPPDVGWTDAGLTRFDSSQIPATRWSFVARRNFLQDRIERLTVSRSRNAPLIAETRDATAIEVRSGRPYNRGIDRSLVQRMSGRTPARVTVADAAGPGHAQKIGNQIELYRPTLQTPDQAPTVRRQMEERRAAVERERQLRERAAEAQRLAEQRDRDAAAQRIRDAERRDRDAAAQRIRDAERRDREARLARERAEDARRDRAAASRSAERRGTPDARSASSLSNDRRAPTVTTSKRPAKTAPASAQRRAKTKDAEMAQARERERARKERERRSDGRGD